MPIPATVFRNILRLEEHKGFTDAAVHGGLEAFARRWADQMASHEREAGSMSAAITGTLNSYGFLGVEERRAAVQTVGELLSLFERGVRDVPAGIVVAAASAGSVANGAQKGNGYLPAALDDFGGWDDTDPRAKAPVSKGMSGIAPAPASGTGPEAQ